jgi:betaine lipid synthase
MATAAVSAQLKDFATQLSVFAAENIAFSKEDVVILCLNMFACVCVYYTLRLIGVPDHSWYLTLYSSGVTSFIGLYSFYHVWHDGLSATIENERDISRYAAIFFIGYCVMDLVLGSIHYESLLTYDDGWTHHFLYIGVCAYLLHNGLTSLFAVALVEELPIVLLSMYEVRNKQKPSLLFGLLYFFTRIMFHTVLIYKAAAISNLIFAVGLNLLLLHVREFQRWIRGYLMRSHNRKRMNFRVKLAMFFCLLAAHTATHGYAAYDLVFNNYAQPPSTPILVMHAAILLFFAYRFGIVVHDVYTQNFIMTSIGRKKIIYNISWEDPAVDHKVMHMNDQDVVLTISSAGCNVLDYLCQGPKKIIAVDMNNAQLHTLELKLACIRALNWENFFAIWGRSDYKVFMSVYESKLRPLLKEETAEFWDVNHKLFRDNFMFAGTSGLMARLLCLPLRLSGVRRRVMAREEFDNKSGGLMFKFTCWICSCTSLWSWIAPLGGVPLEQLNLMNRNTKEFVDRLIEVLTVRIWKPNNYFYYGYIVGEFAPDCCPRYLEQKNFANLKARVDRVDLFYGTWADAAVREGPGSITIASLLDSMDWMPPEMIAENISKVVANMNKEKGRIFWRSFAAGTRAHSPVLAHLKGTLVPEYDRVGWYLTQFIAPTPKNYNPEMIVQKGSGRTFSNSFFADVSVMFAMAKQGLSSNKCAKTFYSSQGKNYDGFREALLPSRDVFMRHVIPWAKEPKTWVSVGCGTARDVEFVVGQVIKSNTKVYLCDLSDALLQMARERVMELGLAPQVVLVEGDINSEATKKKLPKQVDLVTCSYCVTMIPDWRQALKTMSDLVKPGGNLALIDFITREGADRRFDQKLYKWWFANDGVFFNPEHRRALLDDTNFDTVWYSEEEGRVPYTPLHPTHYMYCGEKKA